MLGIRAPDCPLFSAVLHGAQFVEPPEELEERILPPLSGSVAEQLGFSSESASELAAGSAAALAAVPYAAAATAYQAAIDDLTLLVS